MLHEIHADLRALTFRHIVMNRRKVVRHRGCAAGTNMNDRSFVHSTSTVGGLRGAMPRIAASARPTRISNAAGMDDADFAGMRSPILYVTLALTLAPFGARAQTLELTEPLAVDHFASGSSTITDRDRDGLRAVVDWARDHRWRLIVIQGYADPVGGPQLNLTLSQERADATRDALIELGVEPPAGSSARLTAPSRPARSPRAGAARSAARSTTTAT